MTIAIGAIIFVMPLDLHVVICRALGVELHCACLTFDGGRPMIQGVHMLIDRGLCEKLASARLTFIIRGPVI